MHLSDWHSTHESETAVTAIVFAVADTEQKTDKEMDEEMDDIRNAGAPIANQVVIQRTNAEREKQLRAGAETEKITPEREEMMNEHVINADSLVTSKLIAFTTNEFKNSVLKLRKPAGDRNL
jgi:hypothetical protein